MNSKTKSYQRLKLGLGVAVLVWAFPLLAKPRLLILEFSNIERKPDIQYLGNSIHKAVGAALRKKFVFEEPLDNRWRAAAKKNLLFRDDYHTKSVALNIGKLTTQDVVITGHYTVTKNPGQIDTVNARVWIYDIANEKAVAEFTTEGPADSRIFETLTSIAARIADESKVVLPSREEWARSGFTPSRPFFTEPFAGLQGGYAVYSADLSDSIETTSPYIQAHFGGQLFIYGWQPWVVFELAYLNEQPIDGANRALSGLEVSTTNYIPSVSLGHRIQLPANLWLLPRIGGGYLYQSTTVSGYRDAQLTGGMFFAQAAMDLEYELLSYIRVLFSPQIMAQFQDDNVTLLNALQLGMRYYW